MALNDQPADDPRPGSEAPAPGNEAAHGPRHTAPREPTVTRRGVGARLKRAVGRFFGGSGPRTGMRDTDPGNS